jgi:hypothetical protein
MPATLEANAGLHPGRVGRWLRARISGKPVDRDVGPRQPWPGPLLVWRSLAVLILFGGGLGLLRLALELAAGAPVQSVVYQLGLLALNGLLGLLVLARLRSVGSVTVHWLRSAYQRPDCTVPSAHCAGVGSLHRVRSWRLRSVVEDLRARGVRPYHVGRVHEILLVLVGLASEEHFAVAGHDPAVELAVDGTVELEFDHSC